VTAAGPALAHLVVRVSRPDRRAALVDLEAPDYRELFFVVTGDEAVSILAFDASDTTFQDARLLHIPRPRRWDPDADDESMVVQVWEAMGHSR